MRTTVSSSLIEDLPWYMEESSLYFEGRPEWGQRNINAITRFIIDKVLQSSDGYMVGIHIYPDNSYDFTVEHW